MEISINGETHQFTEAMNLNGLLTQLGVDTEQVAIEHNREIVPKSLYRERSLHDGDEIEIVAFIGGG